MGIFDFFKQGNQGEKLGHALLNTALSICDDDTISDSVSNWNLSSIEHKRYKFNFFILNLSLIIHFANTRLMDKILLEETLDAVLANITRDKINKYVLPGNIIVSDIVLYEMEKNYFIENIENNINLRTDGYTLFDMLFENRSQLYCAALDKGYEFAITSSNSMDLCKPLITIFMRFFTGIENTKKDYREASLLWVFVKVCG